MTDVRKAKVNCFKCNKTLKTWGLSPDTNHPLGAIEFTTKGHYGTTVFDPMDGTRLAINICDECMIEAREAKNVLIYGTRTAAGHTEIWEKDVRDIPLSSHVVDSDESQDEDSWSWDI